MKDKELEGSARDHRSVISPLHDRRTPQNTCFAILWCHQRGTQDPRLISADFLNASFLGLWSFPESRPPFAQDVLETLLITLQGFGEFCFPRKPDSQQ